MPAPDTRKDKSTRAEIEDLLLEDDTRELSKRLETSEQMPCLLASLLKLHPGIAFGTAGLRARVQAGFSRINSLTVIQTSQGLAEYLSKEIPGAEKAGIVIGRDDRHGSTKFSHLAAAAFIAKGFKVWWYENIVHTPLVPFAVKHLGAAAGVMITASHNPAQDNGYKVYGSNGCQINSPADAAIAASILQNQKPFRWAWEVWGEHPLKEGILEPMMHEYIKKICELVNPHFDDKRARVPFVYTPLHGVGFRFMAAAMNQVQLRTKMTVVEAQSQPDPDFPTVKYPNPEEQGALTFAISVARTLDISLVLANDPDADRFSAAEVTESGWLQFTGDQIGVLLGCYVLTLMNSEEIQNCVMLTSAVSSYMLAEIAATKGFQVVETLTGFKWLGSIALDLEKQGKKVCFAYEEALGYMFPGVVQDKDGIAAAAMFLSAVSEWGSPREKMRQLYEEYGWFVPKNTYWRSPDIYTTQEIFKKIRSLGSPFPVSLAERKVLRWRDLTTGYDSATPDNIPVLPCSKSSQMITCWLDGFLGDEGIRFTVRASGTEPKIKSMYHSRKSKVLSG